MIFTREAQTLKCLFVKARQSSEVSLSQILHNRVALRCIINIFICTWSILVMFGLLFWFYGLNFYVLVHSHH